MGLSERLCKRRVYIDANIFIYLLEGSPIFRPAMLELAALFKSNEIEAFTSTLTLTEMLPTLVRDNNSATIQSTIDFLLRSGKVSLVPAASEICIKAGTLRGTVGMKTPDAIHVATAILIGCETLLTNDQGIRVPNHIERVLLSDFATTPNSPTA